MRLFSVIVTWFLKVPTIVSNALFCCKLQFFHIKVAMKFEFLTKVPMKFEFLTKVPMKLTFLPRFQ